ncbi:response regulator transcription factor [Salipaludibacillus sp. HK11]|uniref:response regulator transcription factor n=1 Tax=Salipaludibacillus sp. HK11 TaxID=3394320 RepID=UPI0039FD63D8
MLQMNVKVLEEDRNSLVFNDPMNLISDSVKKEMSDLIEIYESKTKVPAKNDLRNLTFYSIQGYDDQTKQFLAEQTKCGDEQSINLLIVDGPLHTDLLKFLLLPVNGIVTIPFLTDNFDFVMDGLAQHDVILEHGLHKKLSKDLIHKKSFSTPIKQFILNKNKISIDLSDRDHQVLQLLLDGHSNSEIAEKMHFARSTVSTIISALLKKMKASDRTDATVKTIRYGWVDCYR